MKFKFGEVIRRERIKQGITQQALSDGICTMGWLSKIELGVSTPAPWLFELLMNRLGKSAEPYILLRTDYEMSLFNLKREIEGLWRLKKRHEGKEKLEEFNALREPENLIDKQFALLYRASFYDEEFGLEGELKLLEEALYVTQPKFDYSNLDSMLLTINEITILSKLAMGKMRFFNTDKTVLMLEYLIKIVELPKYTKNLKCNVYIVLCSNIASLYGSLGQEIECIHYCDKGIKFCIKYNVLRTYPELLYKKAWSMALLGNRELSESLFRKSYNIYVATGERELAQLPMRKAEEKFNVKIL